MKYLLRLSLLALFSFYLATDLHAQVLNGDKYNLDVRFKRAYGPLDTWNVFAAPDINNTATNLGFSPLPLPGLNCYTKIREDNTWGDIEMINMFNPFTPIINIKTSGKYDCTISAWNHDPDEGGRCSYDNGDDDLSTITNLIDARNNPHSLWTTWGQTMPFNNQSKLRQFEVEHTIRLWAGNKSNPLDFGVLESLDTKIHTNHNRGVPQGSDSDLGYTNEWSNETFTASNDVTYKFKITSSRLVIISTDNLNTDGHLGDSYISLVDSTSGNIIAYDDNGGTIYDATSIITERLCPGTYYIVVEGKTASDKGDFELSISNQSISSANGPGSIAISTNNADELSICPNEDIPDISSTAQPTIPTSGTYSYVWKKATYNAGTWSAWSTYENAGNGASASNLGTIENNEKVAFYREIHDCGNVFKTDSIVFTKYNPTISGGSVSLNGSDMIPYPQELPDNGSFTSVTDAAAFPNQTILWEQSVTGGASWNAASGINNEQLYTLPLNISHDVLFRRTVTNSCNTIGSYDGSESTNEIAINVIFPNGKIEGIVTDQNGNGINGIIVTAERTTAVNGGLVNKTYTTTTQNGGQYAMTGLYYGDNSVLSTDAAMFTVTPSGPGFEFDPLQQAVEVRRDLPQRNNINFQNTVGFSITGNVTQECMDCDDNPAIFNLEGVNILEDGTNKANYTDENGKFTSIQFSQGSRILKPEYETHQFDPEERTIQIDGSSVQITNINFKDTTTHVISGNVIKNANCGDTYIGQATLVFSQVLVDDEGSPVASVFKKTITTNAGSGAYSVRLPAAKYRVEVDAISDIPNGKNLNGVEMVEFFNDKLADSLRVRDITNVDTTLNLYFHEKPQIQAFGLEGPCNTGTVEGTAGNSLADKPIFEQSKPRTFVVKVFEGDPMKNCPVENDTLIVRTNIQTDEGDQEIKIETEDGEVELTLTGKEPNIIDPFHKTLSFTFTDIWNRTADNLVLTPVVTGVKARESTFATVSPQIPLLILRDPPGDQSFSFWEQNNSVQTANRFYTTNSDSKEVWTNVRVGAEFSAGLAVTVNSKVWGDLGGSIQTSGSSTDSKEVILTMENSQSYSTSDASNVIGEEGDVYIGAALNFKYAVSDLVNYSPDSCSLYLSKSLMIAPGNTFSTNYTYTESHILNTLIPALEALRNQPANLQAEIDSMDSQISVWQQIIKNNKDLKRKARFSENISFDGAAGPQTSSTTSSSSETSTIEFTMGIDAGVAAELGMEVAGAGISGGVRATFKMETGESESTTNMQSTTTGFTLDDDDSGDFFTVDVKKDPVYNTPVFELVAGTTSCPHEKGTAARDDISFFAPEPLKTGLTAGSTAFYDLVLGNTSQSEEDRTYFVRYLVNSGSGASVNIESSGVGPFDFPRTYLQDQPIQVSVAQSNPDVYSFEGLTFQAYDACSSGDVTSIDVAKEVQISAFYNNSCSPITLASPENGFVLNENANNQLGIHITDYNYTNLETVTLEYARVGVNTWVDAFVLQKAAIENSEFGTSLNFDITNLKDGAYRFRLKLRCSTQTVYSKSVSGIIDRTPPEIFGIPEPVDDVLSLGDEISQTFNENLNCNGVSNANFTLTRLSSLSPVNATIGCFGNKIIITPNEDVLNWLGDSLRASLTNIMDINGNTNTSAYTWDFTVGSPVLNSSSFLANINPSAASINTSSKPDNQPVATSSATTSMNEDDAGTIDIDFTFNSPATDSLVIYFYVAGTATFGADYTVSGQKTFDGQQGSITIKKGTSNRTLKINPTADTDFETDESFVLGLLSGGDYNIGGNNKITLTILNDDSDDDCENNGQVFVQGNNSFGNTAIAAGIYHKALLESDAFVSSPTTVIFKGEKSITLKPGFEVQKGSVFLATQEDCPNTAVASEALMASSALPSGRLTVLLVYTNKAPQTNLFTNSKLAMGESENIKIPFRSEDTQHFNIFLYRVGGGLEKDLSDYTAYNYGKNILEFDTKNMETGEYFFSIEPTRVGETQYHKLVIKE